MLPVFLRAPESLTEGAESGDRGPGLWVSIVSARVSSPAKKDDCADHRLLPKECRELRLTYKAPIYGTLRLQVDGHEPVEVDRKLGEIPIMVKSSKCHLHGMTSKQLVADGEEPFEFGGFFIANGNEKAIRLLSMMRRNYVMALSRPSFTKRGTTYTKYGCMLRCVAPDQTGRTLVLHYLNTGNCTLSVKIRKQEYLIPAVLVLKALTPNSSDAQIFAHVTQGDASNTFVSDRIEVALRDCASILGPRTQADWLAYLGSRFRAVLVRALYMQDEATDQEVGEALVKHFLFVHLDDGQDKWNLLVAMLQKLYALVEGVIVPDSPDSLHCQEVLLPGHLMAMMVKEKLQDYLGGVRDVFLKDLRPGASFAAKVNLADRTYIDSLLLRNPVDIGKKIEYFMSTGNLVSQSGLDLSQVSGYTIVAERLNFLRYLSHYRSIHRGQFFTTMRSTAVRKLLPEAWGFVCPVHTPDGGPCGLLNHLTSVCTIPVRDADASAASAVMSTLLALGAAPVGGAGLPVAPEGRDIFLPVMLDGRVVARIAVNLAAGLVAQLRALKAQRARGLPEMLEIAHVPPRTNGLWPALFLFTTGARMMRPVRQLASGRHEWIGTFEQIHMDVAVCPKEVDPRVHTHLELSEMNMLSVVAQCTPFSDMNQSPRNMYQCQMGKQTMATPMYAYNERVDNKTYRLITPQIPLVRNQAQTNFRMDDYPMGTNAVVAVLGYTGMDMEDAMIINKGSYDRGFGNGIVYTHTVVDLTKTAPSGSRFSNPPDEQHQPHLDTDGLPLVGSTIVQGMALWRAIDPATGRSKLAVHKSQEKAIVDQIRLLGDGGNRLLQRVGIKLRIDRKPIIGDKFSSRHGQKGVLSTLWPQENMPFSETGVVPDVIINPNAFPSRMTIGMLCESMAGKAGAMHGYFPDSTPFRFDEKNRAIDHFAEQLRRAGYNYHGTEVLYSGASGEMMEAQIFMGVVYYQRLRHMVSDKYQVRATGPVNKYTRQPVKGRKAGGGVRFGEMERDGLLAHGASFLLRDRLMTCSDMTCADVCATCGSMLAPRRQPPDDSLAAARAPVRGRQERLFCNACKDGSNVHVVTVPFVFRYLLAELAAMNIQVFPPDRPSDASDLCLLIPHELPTRSSASCEQSDCYECRVANRSPCCDEDS